MEEKEAALVKAADYIDAKYSFNVERAEGGYVRQDLKKAAAIMALYCLESDPFKASTERVVMEEEQSKELSSLKKASKLKYAALPVDPYPMVSAALYGVASKTGGGGSMYVGDIIR